MAVSLFDATVPAYIQIISACKLQLKKAQTWCKDTNTPESEIIQSRTIDDMLPFSYQVQSLHSHSVGSLKGLEAGVFSPIRDSPPEDFVGLHAKLDSALEYLQSVDKETLDSKTGSPMRFEMGELSLPFLAETFMFSFAQPNFYFHATTAYNLLRAKGIVVGKTEFLGRSNVLKNS